MSDETETSTEESSESVTSSEPEQPTTLLDGGAPMEQPTAPPEQSSEPEWSDYTSQDLKKALPEGVDLSDKVLEDMVSLMNEGKLSEEMSGKLVNFHLGFLSSAQQQAEQQWAEQQSAWEAQVRASEIGGDKLESNMTKVREMLAEYGSDDLREFLTVSGGGNCPPVLNFLVKIADSLPNKAAPVGGRGVNNAEVPLEERLFNPLS